VPNSADWHGIENWRAIIRRPWKYVLHENGEEELYNIVDDPAELTNRTTSPDAKSVCGEMGTALLNWCRRTGDSFGCRSA